jgi:hypothetical protein
MIYLQKPHLLFFFFSSFFIVTAQETAIDTTELVYLQKAEFNILGVGVNYEIPISKVLTIDTGLGFSSGVHVSGEMTRYKFNLLNPGFYVKSELKYYYNRYVRVAKKLPTTNGEGSYFGFQNKFITQRLFDSKSRLGNVMMYEVHWGIQRNIFKNLLFNFHVGLGRSHDFTSREGANYASIGIKVSYLIAAKKITRSSFEKFKL